jgi:murein DD-endopeptidase MepM/ murein hydrolase activator NlpD
MGRPQWTLLFVSDRDTTDVRQYRFSPDVLRLSIALVFVGVAAVSSLATSYMVKARLPHYTSELREKNQLLTSELAAIQKQVLSLDTHLDNLARQDEQFRLVAGLELLNEDVRRVGIGGPETERPGIAKLSKLDRNAGDLASSTNESVGELLRRARLLSYSWREAHNTLENKHAKWSATPSIVPTSGYLTSPFSRSRMHPVFNRARPHQGVDISAPTGTPIVAAANGVVRKAAYDGDFGYAVEIDHGYGVVTRYAHASKLLVRAGQKVERGEKVALVGSTGLAVGPHLHYEVLVNGKPTNPRQFFFEMNAIAD